MGVESFQAEVQGAIAGRLVELLPLAGQTTDMIHNIFPAAEMVRRGIAEAEEVLQ